MLCFAVHETGGAGDLHPVPGQLEIREEGDKNNVPSETGLCTISRGTIAAILSFFRSLLFI